MALPSTSAANASLRLDDLIVAYEPLRELAGGDNLSSLDDKLAHQ